jgi:hypothetical protein
VSTEKKRTAKIVEHKPARAAAKAAGKKRARG